MGMLYEYEQGQLPPSIIAYQVDKIAEYRVDEITDYLLLYRSWLEHVTYKPHMTFTILKLDQYQLTLEMRMRVEDTYRPGEMTHVISGVSFYYETFKNKQQNFYKWVLSQLIMLETHETREWFKVDGKIFDNPHAPIEQRYAQL